MGRLLAQRLRHRIDIEALDVDTEDSNDNGSGAQHESWSTIRASDEAPLFPAEKVALRGDELIAAAAIHAEITTRFVLHVPDETLKPSMRVRHDGLSYNVRAILPDPTERRFVQIMTTSGVDDG